MAITLKKANTRQISSIVILILLIAVFVVLMIFIMNPIKKEVYFESEIIPPPEINLAILQNPVLLKLEPFPTVPELTESVGRDNPFSMFSTTTSTTTNATSSKKR